MFLTLCTQGLSSVIDRLQTRPTRSRWAKWWVGHGSAPRHVEWVVSREQLWTLIIFPYSPQKMLLNEPWMKSVCAAVPEIQLSLCRRGGKGIYLFCEVWQIKIILLLWLGASSSRTSVGGKIWQNVFTLFYAFLRWSSGKIIEQEITIMKNLSQNGNSWWRFTDGVQIGDKMVVSLTAWSSLGICKASANFAFRRYSWTRSV